MDGVSSSLGTIYQRVWIVLAEWGLRGEVRADGGWHSIGMGIRRMRVRLGRGMIA